MYKIKISLFKDLKLFKYSFVLLLSKGINKYLIDFKGSILSDKKVIDFLIKYKKQAYIKVKNIPFCINNFNFSIEDNFYETNLLEECLHCSYAISCKGNYNINNDLNSIKNDEINLHRKKIINGIKEIYIFLMKVGFNNLDIHISSNKNILYFYLFEGYDMFFNGTVNQYFYNSENNRLYIYLDNYNKSNNLFMNKGKNLLFKNSTFLNEYIDLMKKLDLDIILYGKEEENIILDNSKKIKKYTIDGLDIFFLIKKNNDFINFYRYLYNNINNKEFEKNISEDIKKGFFKGKKMIKGTKIKNIILEVINITKEDYIDLPKNFVLVGNDTIPKFLNEILKADCLLLQRNNDVSHGAIMSREFNKNCIYGIEGIAYNINSGDFLEINFETLEIKKINEKN